MKFLELVAKSKKEVNVIMFGSVSQWSALSATKMQEVLQQAEKDGYEKVNLMINSPGGSIFEGLAIYNILKAHNLEIVGDVVGMAASMASALLMGCDSVRIGKGSRMMIHSGSSGVYGNASQILQHAKLLESLNLTIAELYADKVNETAEWVQENWMKDGMDSWFTAEQASKAGLVDEVYGSKVKSGEATADFSKMAAHYEGQVSNLEPSEEVTNSNFNNSMFNKEKFPKLVALIGSENITAEAIEAVNAELKSQGVPGMIVVEAAVQEALTQKAKDEAEKATALTTSLQAVMKKLDPEHTGEVTQAAIDGKIDGLQNSLTTAKKQVVELGGKAGASHTKSKKEGGDDIDDEDSPSDEIAKLPHNSALDGNPLFN